MLAVFTAIALASASGPVPITAVRDSYPAISPDGTTLAFHSNRSGSVALYLADIDGSNVRLFLDKIEDPVTPDWSPDGTMIAFAGTVDGQSDVFVVSIDGRNPVRLTTDPGDDSHPHWSADGRIIFNSPRKTPDRNADWSDQWHDVYSMRPDGTDIIQHTECKTVCTFPTPSPDGKRLTYRKVIDGPAISWDQSESTRNSEVFVSDIDGSNERNISNSPAFDGWPVWTPDSNYVVFASNRKGRPYDSQIFAVDPDDGIIFTLTDDEWSHAQPTLSPDGKTVFTYRFRENADHEHGHISSFPFEAPDP